MNDAIPLSLLRAGEIVEVRQVVGLPEQVRRMEELGLHRGARLEMVRPGLPCIVRVGSSRLCIRHGDAVSVLVAQRISA